MKLRAKNLNSYFEKIPGLALAYLFGSAAVSPRQANDIDIALVFSRPMKPEKHFKTLLKTKEDLESLLKQTVDVVILEGRDPLLAFQVISKGKLFFERKKGTDTAFKVKTMTEYHDYLPLHQFFVKRMQKELRVF